MNNDFYGLTIFILTIIWSIIHFITTCRIENLHKKIEKLEKQIDDYAPIPYKEQKETEE
jgi:uncharacterized membrane protein YciS (DUF1049 family)